LGIPFNINLANKNLNTQPLTSFLQQQFQITYSLKEIEMESALNRGLLRELEKSFYCNKLIIHGKNTYKKYLH